MATSFISNWCQSVSYIEQVENPFHHYIFGQCPEVNRAGHITLEFHVALWAISVTLIIFALTSVLSLLVGNQLPLGVGGVASRAGKHHRINSVAPELLRDGFQPLGDASVGANRPSNSERGRNRSVENIIAGSWLTETQSEPLADTHRGSSNSVQQVSPETNDIQLVDSVNIRDYFPTHFWRRSLWPDLSGYRIANPHLLRSLHGYHPPLFVLIVAVSEAVHDLNILQRQLSGVSRSGIIHFSGLDTDVSCKKIYATIKELYDESERITGSELLILLTGHGDSANRMILHGGEFIDETNLYQLLESLKHQNTSPNLVPITIIFDFCRESKRPSATPPEGVSLIWSCSPGENAYAFRLPRNPKMPHSCFLLALIMTSYAHNSVPTGETFESRVEDNLDQLTVYLRKVHSQKHSGGKCRLCSQSDQLCKEPQQNVDWTNVGNMNGIFMLTQALLDTEAAQEVNHNLVMNSSFRASNKLQPIVQADQDGKPESRLLTTNTSSDSGSVLDDGTRTHTRGVNETVHAG